jgi:hypothetical protein
VRLGRHLLGCGQGRRRRSRHVAGAAGVAVPGTVPGDGMEPGRERPEALGHRADLVQLVPQVRQRGRVAQRGLVQRGEHDQRERGQPVRVVDQRVVTDEAGGRQVPAGAHAGRVTAERAGRLEVDEPRVVLLVHHDVGRVDVDEDVPGRVQAAQVPGHAVQDAQARRVVAGVVIPGLAGLDHGTAGADPPVERLSGDELGGEEVVLPLAEQAERLRRDAGGARVQVGQGGVLAAQPLPGAAAVPEQPVVGPGLLEEHLPAGGQLPGLVGPPALLCRSSRSTTYPPTSTAAGGSVLVPGAAGWNGSATPGGSTKVGSRRSSVDRPYPSRISDADVPCGRSRLWPT